MATYRYNGFHKNGLSVRGKTNANSEIEATTNLAGKGIIVSELAVDSHGHIDRQPRPDQMTRICESLAVLIQAGFSAPSAVEYLTKTAQNAALKNSFAELSQAVSGGVSLADALRASGLLSQSYASMVAASEKVNRTAETLQSIASDLKNRQDFKMRLRKALAYPSFLLCAALIVGLIFLFTIFPTIAEIYAQSNLPLPFLFVAADTARNLVLHIGFLVVFVPLLVIRNVRTTVFALFHRLAMVVAPMAHLIDLMQLRNFLSVLAISAASGATVKNAFKSARDIVVDRPDFYDSVVTNVVQGRPISVLSSGRSYFEAPFQLLDLGMQTNRLGQSAEQAKLYVEREIQRRTDAITSLAGPSATILIGLLIGAMAYAMTSALAAVNDAGLNL